MTSQLLHNQWFGKAVGATCAWIWAPSDAAWLAAAVITGIGLGHLYDVWASRYSDDDQTTLARLGARQAHTDSPHLHFLFAALGRIAKTGGRVSREHISYANRLMQQMGLGKDAIAEAQAWFKEGKSNAYPLQQISRDCLQPTEQGHASRLTMLRCMCHMASIEADDATLSCLKQLGGYLGFAPPRIAREFGAIHQRAAQPEQPPRAADAASGQLAQAFASLQVEPGASNEKVKLAYRKLVSRYHPDKLPQGATDRERQHAQTRMVELREALDLIQSQQT